MWEKGRDRDQWIQISLVLEVLNALGTVLQNLKGRLKTHKHCCTEHKGCLGIAVPWCRSSNVYLLLLLILLLLIVIYLQTHVLLFFASAVCVVKWGWALCHHFKSALNLSSWSSIKIGPFHVDCFWLWAWNSAFKCQHSSVNAKANTKSQIP